MLHLSNINKKFPNIDQNQLFNIMQYKTKYNSFLFTLIQLLYNQNEVYLSLLLLLSHLEMCHNLIF